MPITNEEFESRKPHSKVEEEIISFLKYRNARVCILRANSSYQESFVFITQSNTFGQTKHSRGIGTSSGRLVKYPKS